MCFVIITSRSLAWTLFSLFAFMAVLAAVNAPRWLLGPPTLVTFENRTREFVPSVGIYNRCIWMHGQSHCANFNFDGLLTDPSIFPLCWKIAQVLMTIGLLIMGSTIFAAFLGCCVQGVFGKSIFDLTGVAQAVAGIHYLLGLIMYSAGWGAERVQRLCGREADVFCIGDCTLGWASYGAIVGVLLTFICAVFSGQVEKSTASDRVQDKLNEGKTLIILP